MRFGLLGPVAVACGGVLVSVPAPIARSLLAALLLLLNANRVVPAQRLVDVLWGDDPPASAVSSLHNHLRRLRARLGKEEASHIRAVAPGYLIEVAAGDLDLEVFARLYRGGCQAQAAGEWDTAAHHLTAALALWRGEPLEDVTSRVLHETEAPRLSQLRLDAIEARIDADLQLGLNKEAVPRYRIPAGVPRRHQARQRGTQRRTPAAPPHRPH